MSPIAESYLDHIMIAVSVGDRGAPFRDFLDNWYAHEVGVGHLTGGGRPIWFNNPCAKRHQGALAAMQFVSVGASRVLQSARDDARGYLALRANRDRSIRLMVDHAIPLTVIVAMLFEQRICGSKDAIRQHLQRWYHLGVITIEEDAALNAAGLRSRMPDDWDGSVFARYAAANIQPASL